MNEYLIEFEALEPPLYINYKIYKDIYTSDTATVAWNKICKVSNSETPRLIDCRKI